MDLQFDASADGRRLKFLNVIDEHSRLCLSIRLGRLFLTMMRTCKTEPVLMRCSQTARLGQDQPHERQTPHSQVDLRKLR